jgi:hypothetical protein
MLKVVVGIAALSVLLVAVPALGADENISIPIEGVIRGSEGDIVDVATATVDAHLIGARCSAGSVEADEGSTHPDNDYIVSSGDTSATIPDFEAAGGSVVPMQGAITLDKLISIELRLGPDGVSSGGFIVTVSCTPPGDGHFVDDDDDDEIFRDDIEWLADQGITKGCNPPLNDRFCPDDAVTRGQMAAFLARALDLEDQADDPFTDDDGSAFETDIEKLAAAGITKGCNPPTNDRFCPDGKVTREQMAAFLVRAMGYTDPGAGDLFDDDNLSIFEADIDRLATAGVTRGCNPPTNDLFCPVNLVTRGQMAAFLHRALG